MGARSAFTLTELLAVTGALGCLLALFVPAVSEVEDSAARVVCAAHLAQIGAALRFYATDHDGYLPDTGAASPPGGLPPADGRHFVSRFDAPGTCVWPATRSVGNQANLWLLVREGYADAGLFVCPATADRPSLNSPDGPAVMGFLALSPATAMPLAAEDKFLRRVAAGRCSYSYQNQFSHPATDPAVADPLNATTHILLHPSRLAVVADRNPYTRTDLVRQPVVSPEAEPEANSPNHLGLGQNVLYLGGEVEWHESPHCGPMREDGQPDNIYWPAAGSPTDGTSVPRTPADAFLVP